MNSAASKSGNSIVRLPFAWNPAAPKATSSKILVAIAVTLVLYGNAGAASTLLTITCNPPKGTSMAYGVTGRDLLKSIEDHKPTPAPKLYAPHVDGFGTAIITIHPDDTAAVTFEYPPNLGGPETDDMRLLWPPNKIAISMLEVGVDGADARIITFYPPQRVAFFAGNTYSGYVGEDGRNGDELFSYSFFAKCQWNGALRRELAKASSVESDIQKASCRRPPSQCASAKNAKECANILSRLGKNSFDAFGTVGCEPVYTEKAASK